MVPRKCVDTDLGIFIPSGISILKLGLQLYNFGLKASDNLQVNI